LLYSPWAHLLRWNIQIRDGTFLLVWILSSKDTGVVCFGFVWFSLHQTWSSIVLQALFSWWMNVLPVRIGIFTKIIHSKILNKIFPICRGLFLCLAFWHRSVRKYNVALRCLTQGHKIKHFFLIEMRIFLSCILSAVARLNTSISNRAYHKSAVG